MSAPNSHESVKIESLERDLTLHELEMEREPWLQARAKHLRAGGNDPALAETWRIQNDRMDYLLEELFSRTVERPSE